MSNKWIVLGELCVRLEDVTSFQRRARIDEQGTALQVRVGGSVADGWHNEPDPDGALFEKLKRALEAV